MYQKPKVVVIGGGTGLSVVLKGLKHFALDITAIVTVADDGGSSGKLRDEYDIPAPGDLRNVMVALSKSEPLIKDLLQYRFTGESDLSGHPLGNLIITAMFNITGDLSKGIKELSSVFNVNGDILPATCDSPTLMAEMNDGEIIRGESNIPKSKKRIRRVFYEKGEYTTNPETVEAILEADTIVLGIGSLYTSIMPNLLCEEIKEAIKMSKAKKIYICNAMQQPGETNGYTVSDHIKSIYNHVGERFLDTVVVNHEKIPAKILRNYSEKGVKQVDLDREELEKLGINLVEDNLIEIRDDKIVRHHPFKVAAAIYSMMIEYL